MVSNASTEKLLTAKAVASVENFIKSRTKVNK